MFTYLSTSHVQGGQNVNKVNTKAEIRFDVNTVRSCCAAMTKRTYILYIEQATWLPLDVRQRFMTEFSSRINKFGEFVMSSQVHRTCVITDRAQFSVTHRSCKQTTQKLGRLLR